MDTVILVAFCRGTSFAIQVRRLLPRCIDRAVACLAGVRQRGVQQFWCEATRRIGGQRCVNDECNNFDVRPIDESVAAVLVSCNTQSRHFHDVRDWRCDRD